MSSQKVLFVDDEKNILDGIRRQLRQKFIVETAQGPVEGLQAINKNGPFAVAVADLRMPVMDGIKFLMHVKERAPDTVRMILTGNADLTSAIKAVNDGHIFRFMTKPYATEDLVKVLKSGIDQYQLFHAERELLEQTLKGCIRILTETLSMLNPEAFARASRAKRYASEIALTHPAASEPWKMETAAMLSQIGLMTLPGRSLEKLYQGQKLETGEQEAFDSHPQIGFDLLKHIPRLEEVAEIVRCQTKPVDGELPVEARILKAVLDFDLFLALEGDPGSATMRMREKEEVYDADVLYALEQNLSGETKYEHRNVFIEELRPGMVIQEEVRTMQGLLLVAGGQELGPVLTKRLQNYKQSGRAVQDPIPVLVPKIFGQA
jgi:response regulator RpfG family c-di-GMP phosphodiesterase